MLGGLALAHCEAQSSADLQQLLNQGGLALRQGQPTEAAEAFRKVVALAPEQADGYLGLGLAELRGGDGAGAVESLQKALHLNPQAPGGQLFLGIALYQLNRFEESASVLNEAVRQEPHSVEALTWLGMAQLSNAHPEWAVAALDRAYELNPKDANILAYRGRAHTQVAQQCFQKMYDLDPGSWQVHLALAELFSAAQQHEQAITEYKSALVEQNKNPDLYESLGLELQKLGRHDEAAKAYEQALQLHPHSAISLFNLGKIRIEEDDPANGIPLLRQAIEAHAQEAPAYYYLGYGLAAQGKNSEAAEWLEKSLAAHPNDLIQQNIWFSLARVYQKLGRASDSQHALDEFKKWKAANSTKHDAPAMH